MAKNIKLQIEETQQTSSRINSKKIIGTGKIAESQR